ncbi:MAG TPA: hypothetical protein VJP88_06725, partial [Caulobacteraceae bacterium]|nr:hypothetical protein [Caulobacteraceae bacterium]
MALIEEGERGLDLARGVIAEFGGSDDAKLSVDATKVQLHAPFPGRRLAMGGTNYAEHVANAYNNHGKPTTPAEFREKAR